MKLIKDQEKTKNILVMEAVIFQPILLMCLRGSSIQRINLNIQRLLPISSELIKKYLFYLIEYGLISYDGSSRSYFSSNEGITLLVKIERKKVTEKLTTSDLLLYLE
jgi:Tfp pilus assembly ATPase PilU